MNLENHIRVPLWQAISDTYLSENYSHAIRDAMQYVTDFLRDRTGLDTDGHKLAAEALLRTSPNLRINKLQTQSERDEQKGHGLIVQGLYMGIRNPRAHEQKQDTKAIADAIIYFIDYLVGILEESNEPFTLETFYNNVFDASFYRSEKYAKLIVDEIPENRLFDALLKLYTKKQLFNLQNRMGNIELVCKEIYKILDDDQLSDFLTVVSSELRTADFPNKIRQNLRLLLPSYWPRISEISRLRVEATIKEAITNGEAFIDSDGKAFVEDSSAVMATWARGYIKNFDSSIKDSLCFSMLDNLESSELGKQTYIFYYFLSVVATLIGDDEWLRDRFVKAIADVVNGFDSESEYAMLHLKTRLWSFPNDLRQELMEKIPSLKPAQEEDEIPF